MADLDDLNGMHDVGDLHDVAGTEDGPTQTTADLKPTWRGRIHQVSAIIAVPLGLFLVIVAHGTLARVAAVVYAMSLVALFSTSATYHRIDWGPKAKRIWRRLDHSMIYVLIAGSYTPFALLVLDGAWSVWILSIVWAGALVGIVLKLALIDKLGSLGVAMYLVLGWVAIVALPQIVSGLSTTGVVMLATGGILYTVGAVMFVSHWPNPVPGVFGYHEVWHAFVAGAGLCHYVVMLQLLSA